MQASHRGWPCAAGCDACCRRLGKPLDITAAEFELLWDAIDALPDRDVVLRSIVQARPNTTPDGTPQWTCTLLDPAQGRCRVYEARPLTCRAYGFYAGRDGDYWCGLVTAHVAAHRDTLIAGNQVALDRARDRAFGPSRPLATWVRERMGGSVPR